MPPKPIEYAEALERERQAWSEYMRLIDAEAPRDEIEAAYRRAAKATEAKNYWYNLWQEVGGTSNIVSIVDALITRCD
jgi:hypothetical protein